MKENRGNEGTCVGVSRWPVHDFNHRTTSDMWLYRAYSGNLYHNGEQTLTLSSFTQGDFITCVLDMEARTISFGKNGEVGCTIRPKPVQAVFYLLHANTNCLKHINVCLHIPTLAQCDLRVLRLLIIAHF